MNAGTLDEPIAASTRVSYPGAGEAASRERTSYPAYRWIFLLAVVFYVFMAFRMSSVKAPWVDEGWIGSAPANWARTGSFGTPSLVPTGSWLNDELTGVNRYTYWNLPVALVAQAAWFKLLGATFVTMRSLSILCGMLALVSWFVIVSKLAGSRLAGSLAVALLSVDYTFLWSAADGRMDMMCAALGSAGAASYLIFRERHWNRALWLANTFLALALFTHPNGILPLVTFLFLLLYYDRKRLHILDVATLTPYLAIAVTWGVYILQRPDLFLAQFAANAAARSGARLAGLVHPLDAFRGEIVLRYLLHYGFQPFWGGPVPRYAIGIPFLYWAGLAAAWSYAPVRRDRGLFALLCITSLQLLSMTLFVGMKASSYLVFILPLYAAVFAVLVWKMHIRKNVLAPVALALVVLLAGCQLGTEAYKIHRNTYAHEYLPTMQFVRARVARGETVIGDSFFGFDLGFDHVKDDARLGFYSGIRPDLIIEDIWYDRWWNFQFPVEEPELHRYVCDLLETQYRVVFEKGPIRVYERRGA
jgi:4-amino-4-deoxy-L-arabinose transferase-like glycosyltransferase